MESTKEDGNYPQPISLESTDKILNQMKKTICKLSYDEKYIGIGFFCKIPFPDDSSQLSVLITNNHIINESILDREKISFSINSNEFKEINLRDRIKFTNKEYDLTIIEIKGDDGIYDRDNYLELDTSNYKENEKYIKNTVYMLNYPENKNISASYGIINDISNNKYNFTHFCSSDNNSSGSPILNSINCKLIGIHIRKNEDNNIGYFLNYVIEEFINKNYANNYNEFVENNSDNSDNNMTILNLNNKNDCLKCIHNFKSKNLKELLLCNNNLFDIEILKSLKCENLEILNLSNNKISDISVLEKVNFKGLKELFLNSNNISDISVLEKVDFKELIKIDISQNKISDISPLKNFKKLEYLNIITCDPSNLNSLNCKDLKYLSFNFNCGEVIKKINFEKLESIHFGGRRMPQYNFELKELKIEYSQGEHLLEINKYKTLEKLNLSSIYNFDINILKEFNFHNLKELHLRFDHITNIKV